MKDDNTAKDKKTNSMNGAVEDWEARMIAQIEKEFGPDEDE